MNTESRFDRLRSHPDVALDTAIRPPWADFGEVPKSRSAWEAMRGRVEARWRELLGPFPDAAALEPRLLRQEVLPDHTRIHLRFRADGGVGPEGEPDAYLLIPKALKQPAPGLVVLHQTTDQHIDQPVGISGREGVHIALRQVRRGYVCLVARNFLWCRSGVPLQQITRDLLETPVPQRGGREFRWKTGMAKMLWDAIRSTDYLVSRPEVDPTRIGTIGHSLGAKEVIYHAAFDPRVKVAVSCEGGISLRFSNWNADWYLGKQIDAPGFQADHQELLALTAPRAFLLIGGESADGGKSWPFVRSALPIYGLYGAEERLGLLRHPAGHDFPHPGADRELVDLWLDHSLQP